MARQRSQSNQKTLMWIVVAIGLAISLPLCGCCGIGWWAITRLAKPTEFPEETQPYEQARATFKTNLLTKGPPDWDWEPIGPPPIGVVELPYQSGDLKLKAWVSAAPADGQPKPVVVFLHGGFAFGPDDWDTVEPFRRAGFLTMVPVLRGENGLPGHFSLYYDEVNDVLAATDALVKLPYVDPKRIYLCGHSAGGSLTMLTAITTNRFRAAASFAGATDMKVWSRGNSNFCPFDINDPNEFRMRSALAFPKSVKCPLRIYYGDEDGLFGPMSVAMANKARAAGKDVEAIEVDGDHGTMLVPAIEKTIEFFKSK